MLAGQSTDLLEESDVLLAAPDQCDVGQITQRPLSGFAPDRAGRGDRLEDHGRGDSQTSQLSDELREVAKRGDVGALVQHEHQG